MSCTQGGVPATLEARWVGECLGAAIAAFSESLRNSPSPPERGARGMDELRSDGVQCTPRGEQAPHLKATDLAMPDDLPRNPEWLAFDPLAEEVVRLLNRPGRWMTKEEIGKALGRSPTGELGPLLTNLVKRKVLYSRRSHGYLLNLPGVEPPAGEAEPEGQE